MGDSKEMPPTKRARADLGVSVIAPEKSLNDKFEYRLLTFANGFEALLISSDDEKKIKAAAAVSVAVGSFSDPPGRCEGMAHYLEHMLFMGSAKYPGEDQMEQFLTKNGGYSNAYTASAHTNYHFEVNKSELHQALDMFAQFFIAPLLKTDSAERELNAIESEFRLTQNSDSSRVEHVFASFAKTGHPFRTFGWGNLASLRDAPKKIGVDINVELRKFLDLHYRASRLRLCVFGVEPLDRLEEAVLSSFANLPPSPAEELRGAKTPQEVSLAAAGAPFREEDLPKLIRVRPVKDTHKLSISWQLPPTQHLYKSKPAGYISHLVGHEGNGSLLAWFKRSGLATSLSAGVTEDDFESNSMCTIFNVAVTLTAQGLANWTQVVHAVLLYLDMLRREGPQRWVHDEIVQTQEMSWRFLEETNPTDYVEHIVEQMRAELQLERAHLLKAHYMNPEWNPEMISSLLSQMTPDRMLVDILSSAYGRAKGVVEPEGSEAFLQLL